MSEPLFDGYEPMPLPKSREPGLSADQRRTLRQAEAIRKGVHPLTGHTLHEFADRYARKTDSKGLPSRSRASAAAVSAIGWCAVAEKTAWALKAYGTPSPKGSMRCIGGKGRHQLINNSPAAKAWQDVVARAGKLLDGPALSGPVGLQLTVTVERPKSVTVEQRPWPHLRTAGDVDKHARTILDGLEQGGVLADDAQVVELVVRKVYPDTPGVADALPRPGAFIRIYLI